MIKLTFFSAHGVSAHDILCAWWFTSDSSSMYYAEHSRLCASNI